MSEHVSPSRLRRRMYVVEFNSANDSGATFGHDPRTETDDIDAANLITSELAGGMAPWDAEPYHSPTLDLDLDHVYVASSTPGHAHLYLDGIALPWADYLDWLRHSAEIGFIQPGYAHAAEIQGFTGLRPPWVKK